MPAPLGKPMQVPREIPPFSVPVRKKGRKDCRENYRQISLSSIACEVSKKIVKDLAVNFWRALVSLKENQLSVAVLL